MAKDANKLVDEAAEIAEYEVSRCLSTCWGVVRRMHSSDISAPRSRGAFRQHLQPHDARINLLFSFLFMILPQILDTEYYHTQTPMPKAPKRSAPPNDDDRARPSRKPAPRTHRLGVRSCEGCHQRKVRCDRGVPCDNCSRHGMACVYPTRDPDAARTTPTLRDISNCLKRLEILLSRFSESSEATTEPAVDYYGSSGRGHGRAETEIQIQARTGVNVNVNAIEAAGQRPSDRAPNKSTWEILWNNSDSESLLQDVSPGFFSSLLGVSFLYKETLHNPIKLMYDRDLFPWKQNLRSLG